MIQTSLLNLTLRSIKTSAGPSSTRARTQVFNRVQNVKDHSGSKFMSNKVLLSLRYLHSTCHCELNTSGNNNLSWRLAQKQWVCKISTPLANQNMKEKVSTCMVKIRRESKPAWKKKNKQRKTLIWMNWVLLWVSCSYQMAEWLKAVGNLDSVGR